MANPGFLIADTILYSPMEPDGRQFYQGESWPGDAWSAKKGGEPVGTNAAAGALKDLIEANDRLDRMGEQLAAKDHDLAVMAVERDAANGSVHELEQRALAAEAGQKAAEEAAAGYMKERDQARADLQALQNKKAAKADPAPADASASA